MESRYEERMRRWLPLPLLVLAAFLGCASFSGPEKPLLGEVVGVIDGDTLTVLDGRRKSHRIHLQGIDAPERAQAFSRRSTENLSRLVFGKPVRVEWEKRDVYGRILGKVWVAPADCREMDCPKTLDVNLAQVESGMAWWFRRYAWEQPPKERERFEAAEKRAREQRIGLWSEPSPVPPWEFRRPRKGESPARQPAAAR